MCGLRSWLARLQTPLEKARVRTKASSRSDNHVGEQDTEIHARSSEMNAAGRDKCACASTPSMTLTAAVDGDMQPLSRQTPPLRPCFSRRRRTKANRQVSADPDGSRSRKPVYGTFCHPAQARYGLMPSKCPHNRSKCYDEADWSS